MQYDFVAFDQSGRMAVVIEAKRRSRTSADWATEFRRNLIAHGSALPRELFAIVSPDKIYTWVPGAPADASPSTEIDARSILAPYFARSSTQPDRIDPVAFEQLVAWWLDDLTNHRDVVDDKSLRDSGLVNALAGGRIVREVAA